MNQAIVTKYHGPTNTRGSRITATADAGRITVSYDYSKNTEENHRAAAEALTVKLDWEGELVGGGLPGGKGNVYLFPG